LPFPWSACAAGHETARQLRFEPRQEPRIGPAFAAFSVGAAVVSEEEVVLAVVAALGDVVRHPRDPDSWRSWHNNTLTPAVRRANGKGRAGTRPK